MSKLLRVQQVIVSVCIPWDGNVLVVQRSSRDSFLPHHWELPGGKVEYGEHVADAAVREVMEETRLAIRAGRPYFTHDYLVPDGRHMIKIGLSASLTGPPKVILSAEHDEFRWVDADELASLHPITDIMRTMVQEGLSTPGHEKAAR